jgi:hypothetical protein
MRAADEHIGVLERLVEGTALRIRVDDDVLDGERAAGGIERGRHAARECTR